MGRNYFSKAGGPYFINNGLSGHIEHHNHDDSHTHGDINKPFKPLDLIFLSLIPIVFVIAIVVMANL
jgi:hypothetical protein